MIAVRFLCLAGLTVTLLTGCPDREVSKVEPEQIREQIKEIPININRDVDLLFVIDNSNSMEQEQTSLLANFPKFIDKLETIEGGLPNVHIGVISSDMGVLGNQGFTQGECFGFGDAGKLQTGNNGCPRPNDPYIEDIKDGNKNYSGDLSENFQCIANLGTGGCGFEQHLESMKQALTPGTNPNFLRDNAYLAVIFIADEDDCSITDPGFFDPNQDSEASPLGWLSSYRCWEFGVQCEPDEPRTFNPNEEPTPRANCIPRPKDGAKGKYAAQIQDYVDFLFSLKPEDPGRIIVAGIIGDPTPVNIAKFDNDGGALLASCESAFGAAAPSTRLTAFLDSFPGRSSRTSICEGDLTNGLNQIADLLKGVIGTPCLEGDLVDREDGTPGVQPECTVADVSNKGKDNEVQTKVALCNADSSNTPCYKTVVDADNCSAYPSQLTLQVERGGTPPGENTTLVARCLAQ